jgi:PAS domain S-box-containing protein
MNNSDSPGMKHLQKRCLRVLSTLERWLFAPWVVMEDRQRRRMRVLAAFFLLFSLTLAAGVITLARVHDIFWTALAATCIVTLAGYIFSRGKYHALPTVVAVSFTSFPSIGLFLFASGRTYATASLMWLAIPLLVASLVFSLRQTIITAIAFAVILAAILPFGVVDAPAAFQMVSFLFVIFCFTISVQAIRRKDILEIERKLGERKAAEEALREIEEFNSGLLENSPNPIVVIRQDTSIKYVNPAFEKLTGFTFAEIVGKKTPHPWWPDETKEALSAGLANAMKIGQVRMENSYRKKNWERFRVEVNATSIMRDGELQYFLVNWVDITAREHMEESLRFSQAAFRSILEAVLAVDNDFNVTYWNDIAEQTFGIKAADALGKNMRVILSPVELYPGYTRELRQKVQDKTYGRDEIMYPTPEGNVWVDMTVRMIEKDKKRVGYIFTGLDITKRKEAEEKLKHAMEDLEHSNTRLEAANKKLEDFSYSLSHDLRSPLRSIDGFSQALLEDYSDRLDDTGKDYLRRLRGASQKMGELIDGLLKLSRLSRSEIHRENVDLSAMAAEIASRLQETQASRKARFDINAGLSGNGDPQMLRALLENLLGNAWKFTGKVPEAQIEFGEIRNGKQTFFVRDNGAGFDMSYSERIFGAFQRLHGVSEFPGMGIGLATVKRIINRHGGTVRAEGEVGKGAAFYFTLG